MLKKIDITMKMRIANKKPNKADQSEIEPESIKIEAGIKEIEVNRVWISEMCEKGLIFGEEIEGWERERD